MIIDFIVTVLLGVVNAVFSLIPTFTPFDPTNETEIRYANAADDWVTRVGSILALWDLYFPLGILFSCLMAIVAAKLLVVGVQFLTFIWEKLPFKST